MNNVKKSIGWADFTINPVKGLCPVACEYCYARKMYKRFKWEETIEFCPEVFDKLPKYPSRIFIGSTMELFGDWVEKDWMLFIRNEILNNPIHTFIFLTKKPENLIKWSPFPENCYIGVSITDQKMYDNAIKYLSQVKATVKFLSFEPLLDKINIDITG